MRRSILLVALALAACSPKSVPPPPQPAAPPAKVVVSDFSRPMDARGTEPFWALTLRGTTLTLTRPDLPTLTAVAPGAVIQPNAASWTGRLPDGRQMKVTLYASACSDGMSDRAYAYTAEVDVPGEAPLNGCAGKAGAPLVR